MIKRKDFTTYSIVAIFTLIFAVVGLSYNAWRMEVTEDNSNIRTASFEVLSLLSEFEQNIYSLHYDQDQTKGSPRIGWVKVGLIVDLSTLISPNVESSAINLKSYWSENWQQIETNRDTVNQVVERIELVRVDIKKQLIQLK